MQNAFRRFSCALALAGLLSSSVLAQQPAPAQRQSTTQSQSLYTYRVTSELVLVSVSVRNKSGDLVRDLKQGDFTITEDGKAQKVLTFDVENTQNIAQASTAGPEQAEVAETPLKTAVLTADKVSRDSFRDRRMIVLFFDMSAMQPDEVERALNSARNFVDKQMGAADLVSLVSFDTSLKVLQDFTSNRALLGTALRRLQGVEGQGMETSTTGTDEGQPDEGQNFTADDSEYNIFNTDRRLQAIAAIASNLSRVEQKKAILYFSGGMSKTGTENQAQLRAAVNVAVKSNVAIYPVDSRGLQALPPSGDASSASLRGTAAYSGAAVMSALDSNFASQETLVTMAEDTGGKAFLDTNDFGKAFQKVQNDTAQYYVLGYRSTNPAMDGHFRRISVKLNRSDLKLEYRKGYYGPRDFKHSTKDDREQLLADEMTSELPITDLPVYLNTEYFRAKEDRYFVPVSIVVPGSAIPFVQSSDKDKATLDIMGLVREKQTKFPVGSVRDTVKLSMDGAQQVRRKNVQYGTGFVLPPGSYHLKFVVRENENGQMGSFESDLVIPDMKKQQLRMSTVVVASQRVPSSQKKTQNPLVSDGQEIIPNLAHVFLADQPLLFYYEVYDPVKGKGETAAKDANSKTGPYRVLTSIQFFKGKVKVYETPLVESRELTSADRKAVAFQFEVPASQLKPGWYTCQINVVDDAGGNFAFPRLPLLVKAAATVTPGGGT
jgi:VWFA-related protein